MVQPIKFRMKLMPVVNSIRMTIPKAIVETLELEPGQYVNVYISNGNIVIDPSKKEQN